MRTHRSRPHGPGLTAPLRTALLAALIALAVVIGLAAMHALGLHGVQSPASSGPDHASVSHSELPVAHEGHRASASAPAAAPAPTSALSASSASIAQPADHEGLGHHGSLALLCVFVLFIALLLPAQTWASWLAAIRSAVYSRWSARPAPPRPPSLHALGISRT